MGSARLGLRSRRGVNGKSNSSGSSSLLTWRYARRVSGGFLLGVPSLSMLYQARQHLVAVCSTPGTISATLNDLG
jgi:hypothetical protein